MGAKVIIFGKIRNSNFLKGLVRSDCLCTWQHRRAIYFPEYFRLQWRLPQTWYLSRAPRAVPMKKESAMWRNFSTWHIVTWRGFPHDRLSCGKFLHLIYCYVEKALNMRNVKKICNVENWCVLTRFTIFNRFTRIIKHIRPTWRTTKLTPVSI